MRLTTNPACTNPDLRKAPPTPEIFMLCLLPPPTPQETQLSSDLGDGWGGGVTAKGVVGEGGISLKIKKRLPGRERPRSVRKGWGRHSFRGESQGRSLRGAPAKGAPRPGNPPPGDQGQGTTYRTAAVTPPPRAAAAPEARGSYESSSPGSASRSRSASAFRPRRRGGLLPLPGSPWGGGERSGAERGAGKDGKGREKLLAAARAGAGVVEPRGRR